MAEVTLEMLQGLALRVLDEIKATRRETADIRIIVLDLVKQGQRVERRMGEMEQRMGEVRDDLELMLKAELMGRQGNHEARVDARLDELAERIAAIETERRP